MRGIRGLAVGLGLLVALGLLLFVSQQGSSASDDAERACLTALRDELAAKTDADVETVSLRSDGDRVTGEWRYGSVRASSGVMPAGRGEVTCTVRDGDVQSIDVEERAGTS